MSRELLKTIFCHQETIKSRQALHEIFFNLQCKSGLLRDLSPAYLLNFLGKGLNLWY